MSEFKVHTIETAPEGSKPALEQALEVWGMVPNLYGVSAESPSVLNTYLRMYEEFGHTAFNETERQIILITTSYTNNCEYCVAAHSGISAMTGVPPEVVEALRNGTSLADPKLQTLREFTAAMVEERGWVSEDALDSFLAAGYTNRHALEVILGIAIKTISNYTNHVAHTPLDQAFKKARWKKPEAVAAG